MNFFTEEEIACHCGCGINNVSIDLMSKANKTRELLGRPLKASSICRCVIHNKDEGGSITSSHIADAYLECTAIDVEAATSKERYEIVVAMLQAGFTRIGISKKDLFIHGDVDTSKSPEVLWIY